MIYLVELSSGTSFETKVSPEAIETARKKGQLTYLFPFNRYKDGDLRRTVFIDHIVEMIELKK